MLLMLVMLLMLLTLLLLMMTMMMLLSQLLLRWLLILRLLLRLLYPWQRRSLVRRVDGHARHGIVNAVHHGVGVAGPSSRGRILRRRGIVRATLAAVGLGVLWRRSLEMILWSLVVMRRRVNRRWRSVVAHV